MLAAWSEALGGGAWRGATGASARFPRDVLERLDDALPRSSDARELLRALRAHVDLYADARAELVRRTDVDLSDELARQVRRRIFEQP